jgi:hypothetical protein
MKRGLLSIFTYGAAAALTLGLAVDHVAAGDKVCAVVPATINTGAFVNCFAGNTTGQASFITYYNGLSWIWANTLAGNGSTEATAWSQSNQRLGSTAIDFFANGQSSAVRSWNFDPSVTKFCCQAF